MKKYKIFLFANLLTLTFFAGEAISQSTSVIKADAIVYVSDTVVFRLTDYVGEHVKWQLSHNMEDWADIPGATSDSLLFVADTTTYFRARVIAGFCDPFYSDVMKVQVEPAVVTDIDGNVYQTVVIGDQEWLVENLRVSKYNNGDPIPTGLSNTEWQNTTEGAYAIYPHEGGITEDDVEGINSDAEMVAAYGKLYNWYSVDDARGLCPVGWSVPSDDDWDQLVDYVVSQGYPNEWDNPNGAGNALKSCRQVNSPLGGDCDTSEHPRWDSHDTHHGFDEFGFSALPGGRRNYNGSFLDIGTYGGWRSSTGSSFATAWYWLMAHRHGSVHRGSNRKTKGYSLRCVRDID